MSSFTSLIQTKQFVESRTQLKVKLSLKLRNPRNELLKPFNKGKSASMDPTRFPPGMYGEDVHGVGMDLSGGFLGTRTDSSRDYSFLRFNQPINEPCNVYKNADISSDAVETKPDVGSIGDNSSKDESDLWSKMQTEESNKTSSVENTVTENGAKGSPLIGSIAPEEQEKDIIPMKEGPDTKPDMKACDTKDGIKNTGEHPTDMGDFVKVETSEIHYCRFCAAPASSCIDIFETEGQALNLYDKITKCLRLYLSADDQLPNTLCYPCLEKIEFVFSFSEQVYHSHRALIQHLDICQTSSTNFDQVLHSYFEDSNFFSFNTRLMKCEKDWEPNSEEETLPEEQEEAPKNRGKKKKKLNLKNKKKNSQTVGSKKLWKKERMKVKLRFTPSLTTCASCGHKSDTSKENLEHWDQEHKDKNIEYRCFETGCEFRINCVMTMKQHTKEHMFKEGKLTQCEICAKYFAKRQIKAHLAIHSDVCQYSCNKCGKMFKVRSAMITHEKTHDPEYASNSYCCPECGKEYNMKHQFDAHVRRHSEIRPYRCEICSKAFWSPNDLQYHMSIHTGLRPYPCSQCDLKFARPLDVKKHFITRHSEPTKFACSYCPVKYNRRDQLKVHELSHTGETPFKCEICGKGFTRKDKLVRHSDVHVTDDSKYRYSCHLCEKRYTQSGSLFTHMKNSHGV